MSGVERGSLHWAGVLVAEAAARVRVWQAREDQADAGTYVAAGRHAVDAIDAAIVRLHEARAQLVAERRRDDDERAARVDLMLAEARAGREPADTTTTPVSSSLEGIAA